LPHGNGYHSVYGAASGHRRHDVRRLQGYRVDKGHDPRREHTPVGGTSYLHIAINDGAPDQAQVINITKSLIAKPGEWITEVLTVANDPALEERLHPAQR
jgi:hypothetical protein